MIKGRESGARSSDCSALALASALPSEQSLVRPTTGLAAAQLIIVASAGLSSVIYARALGPYNQGIYELIVTTISFLGFLLGLGYASYAVVAVGRGEARPESVLGSSILVSGFVGVVSFVGGIMLWPVLRVDVLAGLSFTLAAVTFATVGLSVLAACLQELYLGLRQVRTLSIALVGLRLGCDIGGVLAILAFHAGLIGVVAATVLNAVGVPAVLCGWLMLHRVRPHFGTATLWRGLSFGLRKHVGLVAGFLLLRIDVFALNAFRGPNRVGVYSVAVSIVEDIWLVTSTFARVSYGAVSGEDSSGGARVAAWVSRSSIVFAAGIAVVVGLLSKPLIPVLFGRAYAHAYVLLVLLLPGVVLQLVARAVDAYVAGNRNRPWVTSGIGLAALMVAVPIYIGFIRTWGDVGAAIGSTIVYTAYAAISWVVYRRMAGPDAMRLVLPYRSDWGALRRAIAKKDAPGSGSTRTRKHSLKERAHVPVVPFGTARVGFGRLGRLGRLEVAGVVLAAVVGASISRNAWIAIGVAAFALLSSVIALSRLRLEAALFGGMMVFGVLLSAPLVHAAASTFARISYLASPLFLFTLMWGAIAVTRGRVPRWVVSSVAGIGGLTLLSATLAGGAAPKAWLLTIAGPLLVFVGLMSTSSRGVRDARRVIEYILGAAVVIAGLVFVAHAGRGTLSLSFVRTHHTDLAFQLAVGHYSFGNPNNASIVYAAAFGVGIAALAQRPRRRAIGWLLTVGGAFDVFTTGSRGAGVAVIVLLSMLLFQRKSTMRVAWRLLLVVAAVGAIAYVGPRLSTGAQTSLDARVVTRAAGLRAIENRPLLGAGPGNAVSVLQRDSKAVQFFAGSTFGSAHDFFLNWGVDTGAVSLIALLGLSAGGLSWAFRRRGMPAVMGLLAYLTVATAAGFSMVNSENPAWAYLFWTLLALAWRVEDGWPASGPNNASHWRTTKLVSRHTVSPELRQTIDLRS